MKTISTFFLLIVCLTSFGQKVATAIKIYKVTFYMPNGTLTPTVHSTRLDTVTEDNIKISPVYFARRYDGGYLPDSLKNNKYKSQKVVINKQNTPEYPTTYTVYDSLSRVITYGNTGAKYVIFSLLNAN